MKKNVTELVCVIDRSISMRRREKQVLCCYNRLLEDYRAKEEKCFVTTCLFADKVNILCLQNEISFVNPLTRGVYYVEGSTALFDAVKTTFRHVDECLEYLKDEIKKQIHVYLITDGMDNGSVEVIHKEFEALIQNKRETGWKIQIIKPECGG